MKGFPRIPKDIVINFIENNFDDTIKGIKKDSLDITKKVIEKVSKKIKK